ncbi:MAG: Ca-activated chloride channel family protein [Saprospiraceae bacterium]|jgi:Ca-activated chloride channel family protein
MSNKDYDLMFSTAFGKIFQWDMYANPHAFYLLLLVPLLLVWLVFRYVKDRSKLRVSDTAFVNNERKLYNMLPFIPHLLSVVALCFLVFAIARPQDAFSWEEEQAKGIDIVIAMDLSSSMLAQDFKPNRVEASKAIASEFIKGRSSDRFGLVVFAGESFTQCPLTIDHKRLIHLFEGLKTGILKDGTAIGSGLATAIKRLKDSKAQSKVVILLTDGENNSGDIAPETAAMLAERFGIKVYTIGVGKNGMADYPAGVNLFGQTVIQKIEVKIDEKLLKEIADKTNGKYFRAISNKHLKAIYKEIDLLERTELASLKYTSKTELFMPFALLSFSLLLSGKLLKVLVFKSMI